PARSAVWHPPCEQSWHTPWLQAWPWAWLHFSPHEPQLLGSVATAVQMPLHTACPTGQTHAPATQTLPPEHAEPQEPQLLLSVWVATQVSPQRTVPDTHWASLDDRQPGRNANKARKSADRTVRRDGVMVFSRWRWTAGWKGPCAGDRAARSRWRGRR